MKDQIAERIDRLREKMKAAGIGAWYLSGTDPHQSEYLPLYWETRQYITGFTGSLGMVVITAYDAALWTDSRYFLQAADELEGAGIRLMKLRVEGTPTPAEWIAAQLPKGDVAATDARCMSLSQFRNFGQFLKSKGIRFMDSGDLLKDLWTTREPLPQTPVFEHELQYVGHSRQEKIALIRESLQQSGAKATVIAALDDVAWTFNLRGADVPCNPVFIAYALIDDHIACLYLDEKKLPLALRLKLEQEGISVRPYETIYDDLQSITGKILIDPDRTNQALAGVLSGATEIVEQVSVPAMLKAIKSPVELDHIRRTMKKDGVAMINFLYWLYQTVGKQEITDYDICLQLDHFRSMQEGYQGISFDPIVGYKETGAIVHRKVSKENAVPVTSEGILLIDCGGQYPGGTTDITRTISLSEPTAQQKKDFTLALKGMIDLTTACFPAGLRGCNLDLLARKAMWDHDINYGHGTSHGVGYFLNVHEGPASIRMEYNEFPIRPGMVLSNEPGIYREGQYGVRTENMMVCVERGKSRFGQFYGFETLTLCPIDLRLIDKSLLTQQEIDWLNQYHDWCFRELAPVLDEEKKAFLRSLTIPL